MKKVLALMLAVLMLASVGCAGAEETVVEPVGITFQDIPWGSNAEAVKQILIEKEYISKDTAELNCSEGRGFFLIPHESQSKQYMMNVIPENGDSYKAVQFTVRFSSDEILKQIAGYNVDDIKFSFTKNGEKTELLCVKLQLNTPRIDEAYSDLQTKLASIYGESKHGDFGGIMYNDVWYGENNTVVMLYYDSAFLSLYYGTLDAENMLKENLANFSNGVDSTDTSGL